MLLVRNFIDQIFRGHILPTLKYFRSGTFKANIWMCTSFTWSISIMAFIGLGILWQITYHMIKIFPARLIPTQPIKEAISKVTHLLLELMTLSDWSSKSSSTTSGQSSLLFLKVKFSLPMMLVMQFVSDSILSNREQRLNCNGWKLFALVLKRRKEERGSEGFAMFLTILQIKMALDNSKYKIPRTRLSLFFAAEFLLTKIRDIFLIFFELETARDPPHVHRPTKVAKVRVWV